MEWHCFYKEDDFMKRNSLMKRFEIAVIASVLAISMAGCGKADQKPEDTVEITDSVDTSDVSDKQGKEEVNKTEEKADEESKKEANEKDENKKDKSDVQGNPVKVHGKLSVKGTQLVDQNGEPYQLCGVSTHGLNWFPEYVNEDGFKTLRDEWGINCVRLAMYTAEGNSYCEGGNKESLKQIVSNGVEYAKNLDMYVIIDWHILHDLDPNKYKSDALAFFEEMSEKYADYENVLYEICNEPNGGTSWEQVKKYAEEVIPVIQKNDPDAIIIVGTPTWSQDVDVAAKNPITGYDNIMYTIHFYADTHRDDIRKKMKTAMDAGLPVFCTEFGICDASGNGAINIDEANKWIDAMDQAGVSYCIWNMSNKNESSSLFKSGCTKTSSWTKDDLSDEALWYLDTLKKKGMAKSEDSQASLGEKEKTDSKENKADSNEKASDSSEKTESKSGDLQVKATCSNNWSDGSKQFYQYDLAITNHGASAVNGWQIELDFGQAVKVDQSWNGEYTENGNKITVKPVEYNRNIEAGQNVDIGFIICGDAEIKSPVVTIK